MKQKYIPNDDGNAILTSYSGFIFGYYILGVYGDPINGPNNGQCFTDKFRGYDIEGNVSPLTGQKEHFTCAELEVYKVVY